VPREALDLGALEDDAARARRDDARDRAQRGRLAPMRVTISPSRTLIEMPFSASIEP
jgi:hypothetical protein